MSNDGLYGPSPYDDDPVANESFEAIYAVVITIVHLVFHGTIGPIDQDDVAQETSLKVWLYWKTRPIHNLRAFTRQVEYTVTIDMQRRFKPSLYQEFPRDESGEIREDLLRWLGTTEESDPEWLAVEEEQGAEIIERTADAFETLKGRQREAALCTLNAHKVLLDDWRRMADALESRGINADLEWPDDQADKQRLQSSFAPARRKMADLMGEDLSRYKQRKRKTMD